MGLAGVCVTPLAVTGGEDFIDFSLVPSVRGWHKYLVTEFSACNNNVIEHTCGDCLFCWSLGINSV